MDYFARVAKGRGGDVGIYRLRNRTSPPQVAGNYTVGALLNGPHRAANCDSASLFVDLKPPVVQKQNRK